MFPPRYGVNGGLGVDVFEVAAGAGVLTLTARFVGLGFGVLTLTARFVGLGSGVLTLTARAKFEGLIETDGPKEVVRLI